MARYLAWIVGASVAMTAGCDEPRDPPDADDDDAALRELVINSMKLNGMLLNGMLLNGMLLNGMKLNGPDGSADFIQTIQLDLHGNDQPAQSWLVGSDLTVLTTDGEILSGTALDKARFEFEVEEGGHPKKGKQVRIDGVRQLAPGSDVWLYDLAIKDGTGPWKSLCEDSDGESTEAILIGELWNPETGARLSPISNTLTFACRGAALAKCVEWGYRPWASAGGATLSDHHQACTRLVRADYCGDGEAHTLTGTPVHVLDQVGVQDVDPNVQYVVEAEWGPDGAVCLNAANMRLGPQTLPCDIPACGASFSSGGLIQSGKIAAP